MSRPRLLLADDHKLTCEGLRALLEPAHEVVGTVHDGLQVQTAVTNLKPDLVLLDLALPGRNGIEVARELKAKHPKVKTLLLTMHADPIYVTEGMEAGASGYLLKLATSTELSHAIAEVMAGRTYISPELTSPHPTASGSDPIRPLGPGTQLTPRQREVLKLTAQGFTSEEIGEQLGISPRSVEFHHSRIRTILGLSNRAALIRYAVTHGIIEE